jgi:hypothetical protein
MTGATKALGHLQSEVVGRDGTGMLAAALATEIFESAKDYRA